MRVHRGDDAFEQWVAEHWSAMRRLAERLVGPADRDDVLQEALTAAWRSRGRFDPERGSARSWLLAITANHAKKALRRARRREPRTVEPAVEDPSAVVRVDLQRAVRALPERQRLAVELVYFVDLTVADAAAVLGCAEGTVKSSLSAARTALRHSLGDGYR